MAQGIEGAGKILPCGNFEQSEFLGRGWCGNCGLHTHSHVQPAELPRTPEPPEPYCPHASTMGWRDCVHCNPDLREITRAERNALGDEAMKAAQKPAMSREEAKEFLKGVVERVRSRGLRRPDSQLAELEGTRSFPKQCPDCREHHPDGRPCGKRDPLAELLAAAKLPIELRKYIALTGLDSGVRKWHKRLNAAVAAFGEGK